MNMRIPSTPSSTNRLSTASNSSDQTGPNGTSTSQDSEVRQAMMRAAHSFMGGQLQKIMAKQKEDAQKLSESSDDN